MASHKSAIKRAKQSEKRQLRNTAAGTSVKTAIKKVLSAVTAKDKEGSKEVLATTIPQISKAAAKGILHKRNASRKISRLTRKVNALQG
ncbi:MAG: 30S ribosomal protein S20 [Syntrophus sp. SKADARSKE-3]|nr:30S ribosomal protein S20 [Syntrophus sp. SKADARSKE-3]